MCRAENAETNQRCSSPIGNNLTREPMPITQNMTPRKNNQDTFFTLHLPLLHGVTSNSTWPSRGGREGVDIIRPHTMGSTSHTQKTTDSPLPLKEKTTRDLTTPASFHLMVWQERNKCISPLVGARQVERNLHGQLLVRGERVNRARNVRPVNRLAGEEDQHVTMSLLGLVDGIHS